MKRQKVKIKNIAEQIRGVSYKPTDVGDISSNGYTAILRANNITSTGLNIDDLVYVKNDRISNKQILKSGDILIAASSGSKSVVGKAVSITNNIEAAFGAFCKVVRPNAEKVNPRYLGYFFQSPGYRRTISELAEGANINNIRNEDIDDLELPLPPLQIQEQIADTLDKADALRRKDQELLKKYDELSQAIFYEMFGDPVKNEMKWKKNRLGASCEVGSSIRVFVDELAESGIPFYRGSEIGKLSDKETFIPSLFISEEHYLRLKYIGGVPKIGDLLLPSICADGRIYEVQTNTPFYFKDGRVLWIKVNNEYYCSAFLKHLLKEVFLRNYSSIASGTTFAELKIFNLLKLDLILPPISLQEHYTHCSTNISNALNISKESICLSTSIFEKLSTDFFHEV